MATKEKTYHLQCRIPVDAEKWIRQMGDGEGRSVASMAEYLLTKISRGEQFYIDNTFWSPKLYGTDPLSQLDMPAEQNAINKYVDQSIKTRKKTKGD